MARRGGLAGWLRGRLLRHGAAAPSAIVSKRHVALVTAALIGTLSLTVGAGAAAGFQSGSAAGSSLTLASGDGRYLFEAVGSGEQPIGSISWAEGQDLAVSTIAGQAISIGHTAAPAGSFASNAGAQAIAGIGISGYTVTQTFSAQKSKPAHKATRTPTKPVAGASLSLAFTTTEPGQIVVILTAAQGTGALTLSGIEASTLQNASYGPADSATLASTAIYAAQPSVGKHKAKWKSATFAPNSGSSMSAVAYVLTPAPLPTVTEVAPNNGPEAGGTTVTITGTNFSGAIDVKFGTSNASGVTVLSPTSIQATAPPGAGTTDVTVRTQAGTSATSASDHYTYTTPPPPFYVHHVYGTCADGGCGLHERPAPAYTGQPSLGLLNDGDEVDIVCQTTGELVTPNHGTPSNVWDRLTNGHYVTDVYIDTPGTGGGFSPPIPHC